MKYLTGSVRQLYRVWKYCISLSGQEDVDREDSRPFAFVVFGAMIGILISLAFAGSWKVFGDIYFTESTRLRVVPSAIVVSLLTIINLKQLTGFGVTAERVMLGRRCDTSSTLETVEAVGVVGFLFIMLLVLLEFSVLLAMPSHVSWWPDDWRHIFNWCYPKMHYRVLILACVWNKAGLLIAGGTGNESPQITGRWERFRKSVSIKSLLANLVIVTVVSTIYFSTRSNRALGLIVSLAIFMLIYIVSMWVSARRGGHDRHSMFACAQLGELSLLLGYLVISGYLFQP